MREETKYHPKRIVEVGGLGREVVARRSIGINRKNRPRSSGGEQALPPARAAVPSRLRVILETYRDSPTKGRGSVQRKTLLVTGSSGLIGSEVATHFDALGWTVHGIDNNQRAAFFGTGGDTRWNQQRLENTLARFHHHEVDIRDRQPILDLVADLRPAAIVHTAAQPSHDRAASIPFDDFDTNAVGTLNLLEAARRACPESPFVHMSTNKVYGDAPNEIPLVELATRWDYADVAHAQGIPESFRIDASKHSLFGASKLAADVMVQEYGRYFGMPTCCLRGGCLTGPSHSGVELHGFLSYLVKCNLEGRRYTVFGYKGKQVRDNIHAADVSRFIARFIEAPRPAAVYNIGGGRANSCSVLEAFSMAAERSGRQMEWTYDEKAREGDHICYYSDLRRIESDYPGWRPEISLAETFNQLVESWERRRASQPDGSGGAS
jgi:CDP-paratose 2-epimerase